MLKSLQNTFKDNLISVLTHKPALLVFVSIFMMVALNAIFNSLAVAFGYDFPRTTFLFTPNDLFADYFKVIFSYPGANVIQTNGSLNTSNLLLSYLNNNPFHGAEGLVRGTLTHFHLTPFTTLFSLMSLKIMKFIAPQWLFFLMLLGFFISIYLVIIKVAKKNSDRLLWFLSVLICYPTLFVITRGNIFAGITSLSLIGYIVLVSQDKKRYLALFLLAIAVNIRPNAIIFILALMIGKSKLRTNEFLVFFAIAGAVFLNTLYLSNLLYPDYTFSNFLSGLKIYHAVYIANNGGLAYGSSLFGALKYLFNISTAAETYATLLAGLFFVAAVWFKYSNKVSNSIFIFIICSCYVLGSSVFADYHLGVFFAPLFLHNFEVKEKNPVYLRKSDSVAHVLIFFGSVFMLTPKNYVFHKDVSVQVALNPIVLLLIISSFIIYYSFIHDTDKPVKVLPPY